MHLNLRSPSRCAYWFRELISGQKIPPPPSSPGGMCVAEYPGEARAKGSLVVFWCHEQIFLSCCSFYFCINANLHGYAHCSLRMLQVWSPFIYGKSIFRFFNWFFNPPYFEFDVWPRHLSSMIGPDYQKYLTSHLSAVAAVVNWHSVCPRLPAGDPYARQRGRRSWQESADLQEVRHLQERGRAGAHPRPGTVTTADAGRILRRSLTR